MGRHISFWIGFFAAALLIVPIALFVWGLAQDRLFDLIAMLFGALVALVALLIIVLVFRGQILRKFLGRSEAGVEEITRSLVAGVSAAASGDVKRAEAEAETLARVAIGWYTWSNFYRWVIGTCVALLVAFATFTGSVLLFEQTQRIGQQTEVMQAQTALMEAQTERLGEQTLQAQTQNEILTLSLVSELRQQLVAGSQAVTLKEYLLQAPSRLGTGFRLQGREAASSCKMGLDGNAAIRTVPGGSTRAAIAFLAREGLLANRVQDALRLLLADQNRAVAFGALLILDEVGFAAEGLEISFERLIVREAEQILKSDWSITLKDSYLINLKCRTCKLHATGSVILEAPRSVARGSLNLEVPTPRGEVMEQYPTGAPTIYLSWVKDRKFPVASRLSFSGAANPELVSPSMGYVRDAGYACDLFGYMAESAIFQQME